MTNRGFSLVECLVATVVMATGLLALTASSRAAIQLTLLGNRTTGAADIAASRFAQLRSNACQAGGGAATTGPYQEQWSVTPAGATRAVSLEVRFVHDGRLRSVRYDGMLLCLPR